MTDNKVNSRILAAARDASRAGHAAARRIANHDHFKVLYQRHPEDVKVNPEAGQAIFRGAKKDAFGEENVRYDKYTQKREASVFPVLLRDGRIASAEKLSEVLQHLPVVAVDCVFLKADLLQDATHWLTANRDPLIQARKETWFIDRLQEAAILTELADQLRSEGSWCGHTHMQKAPFFLQDLLEVPTGYEFILSKHGSYSFDLSEEMTALRADYLIEFDHRSPGYGPGLVPTGTSAELRSRYPVTLAKYVREIAFIAQAFGSKGVTEPEKLATALHVTRENGGTRGVHERARRIVELKPHVPLDQALDAVRELDRIGREAAALASEGANPQNQMQ